MTIRKLASPQRYRDGDATVLQRFEAVTDAEGKFNFTLPTDHAFDPMESLTTSSSGRAASAQGRNGATFSVAPVVVPRGRGFARPGSFVFIPLEIDATQPNYAPCRISMSVYPVMLPDPYYQGDGFATPPEKHDPAERSIGVLELRPGKEVTGVVQSPDGKPLTGAKVLAHSVVPKNEREIPGVSRSQQPRPADEQTQTDADGRFRVTMITPGEGMLEIYPAKDFAPLYKNVYDEHGDVGVLKVSPGTEIKGRVLDAKGKPLPRVFIQVSSSDKYFNSYYDFLLTAGGRDGQRKAMPRESCRSLGWRQAFIALGRAIRSTMQQLICTISPIIGRYKGFTFRTKSRLPPASPCRARNPHDCQCNGRGIHHPR